MGKSTTEFEKQFLQGREQVDNIYRLAYVSEARADVTQQLLRRINFQASSNNAEADITSCLLAHGRTFFQLLEGPEKSVTCLADRIAQDTAHHNFKIVLRQTGNARSCPFWAEVQSDLSYFGDSPVAELLADLRADIDPDSLQEKAQTLVALIEENLLQQNLHRRRQFRAQLDYALLEAKKEIADSLNPTLEGQEPLNLSQRLTVSFNAQNLAKRRMEAALAAGDFAMYDWEVGSVRVATNERWFSMLGYSSRDHESSFDFWKSLVYEEDIQSAEQGISDYLEGLTDTYDVTVRMRCKDGSTKHIRCTGLICEWDKDNQPARMVGVHQDVTEEVKLREELQSLLRKSEDIITEKVDYLAKLSHEIRTPLTGIIGQAALLQRDPRCADISQQIADIAFSANHLKNVVEGALYLSKSQSGTLPVHHDRINVAHIIESVVSGLATQAGDKGLNLIFKPKASAHLPLIGDGQRLIQIAYNLINNAIKYSENGDITVSLAAQDGPTDQDVSLVLEVRDQGPGISAENQRKIFNKFEQLGQEGKDAYSGVGLGLAIVAELVAGADGNINLESSIGVGTAFQVSMPLKIAENADALDKGTATTPQLGPTELVSQLKVLVAEDNRTNIRYISAIFEAFDIQFDVAKNGQEALDMANGDKYDVLALDVNMPSIKGPDVAKAIQAGDGPNKSTPIVALTANVFPDDLAAYRAAGMAYHIGKPFTPEVLIKGLTEAYAGGSS